MITLTLGLGIMFFDEWQEQSLMMFNVADDVNYLLCESVQGSIYKAVNNEFIHSKLSKTDFKILNVLIENYWDIKRSFFSFPSFEVFIKLNYLSISKPNLSRSLKALESSGFIKKVDSIRDIQYKFIIAFDELVRLT
jgi:hypothetical protein